MPAERRQRLALAALLAAAAALGLVAALLIAPRLLSGAEAVGRIAFGSREGIFVVGSDGDGLRRLTSAWDDDPAWSPDGTQIAFTRVRNAVGQIFAMRPDGSDVRKLTSGPFSNSHPSWSPDGRRIAFERDTSGRDGTVGIYVMDADGSRVRRLVSSRRFDFFPDWSPDGTRIAFQRGLAEIFVVNADGSGLRRVASGEAYRPVWSPDGTKLLFDGLRVFRGEPRTGIYAVSADGGRRRLLREGFAQAAWSPDGKRLAVFTVLAPDRGAIFVMDATGRGPARLIADGPFAENPDWEPRP